MNIQNLIKLIWILFFITCTHTYANTEFIQDDLVGTWKCSIEYQDKDGVGSVTTLDRMNVDGTMTQLIELAYHNQNHDGFYNTIDTLVVTNHWQFKNNRLDFTDIVIENYRGFDYRKIPYILSLQEVFKKSYQYDMEKDYDYEIEIIDRNHFNNIIEDIDSVATNFSYCQRMS